MAFFCISYCFCLCCYFSCSKIGRFFVSILIFILSSLLFWYTFQNNIIFDLIYLISSIIALIDYSPDIDLEEHNITCLCTSCSFCLLFMYGIFDILTVFQQSGFLRFIPLINVVLYSISYIMMYLAKNDHNNPLSDYNEHTCCKECDCLDKGCCCCSN